MYSAFMQYNEVFVTGGTGLLGPFVCRALIDRGFLPRLLVRTGSEGKIEPDIRGRSRVSKGDLTVREAVEMGAQGTSTIVHLAGAWKGQTRRGISLGESHIHATANILHAASVWGIRRLVFVSVAGARSGDPVPYLDAKGRAEELLWRSDRAWTIFRPVRWYDLRDGRLLVAKEYLAGLAGAIADSVRRPETERHVYESDLPPGRNMLKFGHVESVR